MPAEPAALSPLSLTESGTVLCLLCILLVPFAWAGLTLVNAGFGRARSAAHSMLSALCVFAVAVLVYLLVGFSLQGFAGAPAQSVTLGGRSWSLLGSGRVMMHGIAWDLSTPSLIATLQLFSVAFAAMIPLGSGSDRWRLGASCASTALLAGIVYPIFAHWVWGGGWLAQLGTLSSCGNGALDAGGAGTIQAVGGLAALSITWVLGPRLGKYEATGMAIPAHNMPFVLFGCMLTLIGWLGLDAAGAMLFAGAQAGSIVLIAVNNAAAAAMGLLTALLVTRFRYGKPDASISANGFVIGLVSVSGACSLVSPALAAAIGLVGGLMVPFSVEWLDRLGFDDPSGTISVHALGGLWGVLATGFFGHTRPGQWLAQLAMFSALLGFVLPLAYTLNRLLDRFYPQRISKDGERQGLDMCELGAGAYPEWTAANKEHLFR
jgi:ammonium transporter, Amt family